MTISCVNIAPGQRLWTYWPGYSAMVFDLSSDNSENTNVRIVRDRNDDEWPIEVKLINVERVDEDGNGIMVLRQFENTDSGWLTAQAWTVQMLDLLNKVDLDEVTSARIQARLRVTA